MSFIFFTHSSHPGNSIQVYLSIYDDSVTSEALSFTCVMAVGCIWGKKSFSDALLVGSNVKIVFILACFLCYNFLLYFFK